MINYKINIIQSMRRDLGTSDSIKIWRYKII